MKFDPELAAQNARRFSVKNFLNEMRKAVSSFVADFFGEELIPRLEGAMTHVESE